MTLEAHYDMPLKVKLCFSDGKVETFHTFSNTNLEVPLKIKQHLELLSESFKNVFKW